MKKVRAELNEKIINPYLKQHSLEKLDFNQILDILSIENSQDLTYISNCLTETLRIESSAAVTSTLEFTEDVDVLGFKFKANE